MSANNPSDSTPPEAPVATPAAPAAPVAIDGFGSSRGTGLARGKRPARPASNAADSRDSGIAGYQPTAIQVVVAPTEYVNPFEPAPVAIAPALESVPATPVAPASPEAVAPTPAPEPAPAPAPVQEYKADVEFVAPASAPKAELNILPPAAPRPTTSWESPGAVSASVPAPAAPAPATASGDRPVFRIERKPVVAREIEPLRPSEGRPEGSPYAGRDNRHGGRRRDGQAQGQGRRRDGGEGRRDGRRDGGRPSPAPGASASPAQPHAPRPSSAKPAPEKGGGFVGWLKGIFGGASEAPSSGGDQPRGERAPRGEGQGQGRRRRRGGRGRSGGGQGPQTAGENRAPRPDGAQQPRPEGAPRGDGKGGRHRGGRGPRPDGSGPRPSDGGSRPAA